MTEDEALNKFIEDILVNKNLSGMTDEAKVYLIDDLKTKLLDQINRALINELSEDQTNELNSILDEEFVNDEKVQQFIVNCGVDVSKITARTMLFFRDLYLQTPEQRNQSANPIEV